MTTQSPTNARLPLEERRKRQILPAVIAVVAEEGFDGATMRKIADRAGVSTGMLTYYYKNKRDLIEDALRDSSSRSSQAVDEALGSDIGPGRIEALFESMLERSSAHTFPLTFWLAYWSEAARDEELKTFSLGGLNKIRTAFRNAVATGISSQELRGDLDPDLAADLLMLLWQGARAEVGLAYMDETRAAQVIREGLRLMEH